ncbi:transglycosylase SLT domain-containing protein [Nitratifractor sp.]
MDIFYSLSSIERRGRRLFLLGLILLPVSMKALSILEVKYPSASYVLKEFDIDPTYIRNPSFVDFILRNETRYRRFYENSAKRGKTYIPLFKELLSSGGLSHLFVYMSMTESGFQSYAKSKKKAAGLWQFMAATAKRFKLRVDKEKDERYDPVASTKAAMQYIHALYKMFGKWYLVMMAYNCGEGRLMRAIQRAGSDDFAVLMDDRKAWIPEETRNYLRKIILLSMMGEKIHSSPAKEDRKLRQKILPDTEMLVNVYGGTSLERMAKLLRMNVGRLQRLNPQIRGGMIARDLGMTQIFIPADRLGYYRAFYRPPLLREIYKKKGYSRLIAHIVRRGETLKSVARRYHSTPLDLVVANQLSNPRLRPGNILMVPVTQKIYESLRKY